MSKQNRIREIRKKAGLSQAELAQKLGVTRQAVSLYERGERQPNDETWEKLGGLFAETIHQDHPAWMKKIIPYLKGVGLMNEAQKNKVILFLHESYFNISQKNFFDKTSESILDRIYLYNYSLKNAVNAYIKCSNIYPKPEDFYSTQEKEFKLNDSIKDYWFKHFDFLLKNPWLMEKFKNVKVQDRYANILNDLTHCIEKENEEKNQTALGKVFKEKYRKEDNLQHRKMREELLYASNNQSSAIIDSYISYLERLKQDLSK